MRLVIYPYNIGSKAAREIARQFNTKVVRENGNYVPRYGDVIVNWGGGRVPRWNRAGLKFVNSFESIKIAKNKRLTFDKLKEHGVSIPEYTTDATVAKQWCDQGAIVVCRELLEGSGGNGIKVARTKEELVSAPLYVKYIKKKKEFRIHVVNGRVIDYTEKKRSKDAERTEESTLIRNKQFGWVFCRENVTVPECVNTQALLAVKALGLDFGAVDIIWNQDMNKAFVLEINSACGLEGKTIDSYCRAFSEFLKS